MTGIAGLVHDGRVWMAGDSASVGDSHYLQLVAEPKVFARDQMVFGFTSSFWMGRIIQYRLVIPSLPDSPDVEKMDKWMAVDFADAIRSAFREAGYLRERECRQEGGVFLVGVAGLLYNFDDDFHASRALPGFTACGSGVSVILGSLFSTDGRPPEERLLTALSAAENFTTSVRAPFTVVSTLAGSK